MSAAAIRLTDHPEHRETLRLARADTAAGDDASADRRIRGVLAATRAARPPVWWLAVANLIALYMRQDREVESLRLARLASDGYAHDRPEDRAFSLQVLCMAFANLEDRERIARELPRFEASIGGCDAAHAAVYGRSVALLRALSAMWSGDLLEARLRCDEAIASFDETATPITRGPAHLIAGQIAHRDGRFADGLASARLARANSPSRAASLPAILVETQCTFDLHGAGAACDVVRGALGDVESLARSPHEPSHAVQTCSRLAEFVTDRCGDEGLARRLLDAAVAAVLRRAEQLAVSLDDLPELAATCDDDEHALAAFRVRFRLGKQRLLTAVAGVVRDAGDGASFLRGEGDAAACVCAWCLRVRRAGAWVPVGHFLEGGFESRVTHGLCPDCAQRL